MNNTSERNGPPALDHEITIEKALNLPRVELSCGNKIRNRKRWRMPVRSVLQAIFVLTPIFAHEISENDIIYIYTVALRLSA